MAIDRQLQITDPRALRALAHPLRLRVLEILTVAGPASGRELAERTGESTASISYHVAQLVRWDLVESPPELARGRERPWRATSRGITWSATGDGSPEFAAASRALRDQFVAQRLEVLTDYQRSQHEFDPVWQEAAWVGDDIGFLTPDELTEATARVKEVLREFTDPARPRQPNARRVAFFGYAVPTEPPTSPASTADHPAAEAPSAAEPAATAPDTTAPDTTAPDTTAPDTTAPGSATPASEAPASKAASAGAPTTARPGKKSKAAPDAGEAG